MKRAALILGMCLVLTFVLNGCSSNKEFFSNGGNLLTEEEAVETLEKLFEAVTNLNGIKFQLAEYEDATTWTDTFEQNGVLYACFDMEVKSSLIEYAGSEDCQEQWKDYIYGWNSLVDIESDILDVFETLEDSNVLKSLVNFLFVEKDGKLYYSAHSGSFGSSPYKWDITTVKVVENTEHRVIFEARWGFDQMVTAKLTMVKNSFGKWVLTRDYWGENITFNLEDAFLRVISGGEACKLLFTSTSEKYITLDFTDTIEEDGVTYAKFVEFLHNSEFQWTSIEEVTNYFLKYFEKPDDAEPLQRAIASVFIEKNGKLYYCTDTVLSVAEETELLPCEWEILTIAEEKEDGVQLETKCWKDGGKEPENRTLTIVKGTDGTWRLKQDYWGDNKN